MIIVSSGEFRQNQKEYFDKIDKGEEVIVQRGKNKSYKLVPVTADDTLMSKKEFYDKIHKVLKEMDEGNVTKLTPEMQKEMFQDFL